MYAKRIQLANYGPIEHVDITFPFTGGNPKPMLIVGENGSGKSILLSHIVNFLMIAQSAVYPDNSEVEEGKVYKIRSLFYIRVGKKYYEARVDFENGLYCGEIQLNCLKKNFPQQPVGFFSPDIWGTFPNEKTSHEMNNLYKSDRNHDLKSMFDSNCVLYFPHNRFEEPAWLNERNLRARAEYMNVQNVSGYTNRGIINYSPLRDNQNWLFEVLYDRAVFDATIASNAPPYTRITIGPATNFYNIALGVVQKIFRAEGKIRFGIEKRRNRRVSLIRNEETLAHNIFQLSSGETSLLNLFLSILRDFDLSGVSFANTQDVRGIVIVDEIDLHLHAIHQHDILPELIKMFPRVQFIVTTHSPLFVLGMQKAFGPDGFALYRLPQGEPINPEEFSEFGKAYQAFTETMRFSDDINRAQKPTVFVEGITDVKYLQKAAALLDQKELFDKFDIKNGHGSGNLGKFRKNYSPPFSDVVRQKIVFLYDCDNKSPDDTKGKMFKRSIPKRENNPLQKGIENLFERDTLERARQYKPAFINIAAEHQKTERGEEKTVPEEWVIDKDEKTNLCDWLCENGTKDDFKHFQVIFGLLERILADDQETMAIATSN